MFTQSHLRDQNEDRHGCQAASCPQGRGAGLRKTAAFAPAGAHVVCHQKRDRAAPIDEPQAYAVGLFPKSGRDALAHRIFACGLCRNAKQCGRYGEVHDITEGIIPDITPYMGITVGEKRELEMMAINHIGTLSRGGQRIRNNWLEYDAGANDEALFVHGVDKLHPCYVALEYEKANVCRYSLQPFWDYAFAKIQDSPLNETWEELNKQRPPNAGDKPILERRPKPPGTFAEMKRVVEQRCGLAR